MALNILGFLLRTGVYKYLHMIHLFRNPPKAQVMKGSVTISAIPNVSEVTTFPFSVCHSICLVFVNERKQSAGWLHRL